MEWWSEIGPPLQLGKLIFSKLKRWNNKKSKELKKVVFTKLSLRQCSSCFNLYFTNKGLFFCLHPTVIFQRSTSVHWSKELWMIYLEKWWGNGEQITSWLVGRTRCFQLGVYSQYTRFARLITAKNRSQMIYIIALQRLFLRCCSQWTKKGHQKISVSTRLSVLSSCTGSQERIQQTQQCSTAKQRLIKKGVQCMVNVILSVYRYTRTQPSCQFIYSKNARLTTQPRR